MSTDKQECDICVETVAILVSCPQCSYNACKTCTSKYLCESINEPRCMNCKHPFTREHLIKLMGTSWYEGKYKNTRKQVLLESEKAKFTETMEYAEKYKNIEKYESQIRNLHQEYTKKYKEFQEFKKMYNRQVYNLEKLVLNIQRGVDTDAPIPLDAIDTGGASDKKTKTITKLYTKCPKEGCIGMMNENNKCINCNTEICGTCFEVVNNEQKGEHSGEQKGEHSGEQKGEHSGEQKGEHSGEQKGEHSGEHKCDPNTIETLKLLKKDTKNCPGCSTPIHRIEGCYQMWCTKCHITFHYRTLEILNEKIHNPHYVDWLKNNTTIQTGECQALGYYTFSPLKNDLPTLYRSCCNIYRHVNHMEAVVLDHARRQLNTFTNQDSKRLTRAQYMIGKLDEKKYKMLLFKSYKQTQRWGDVIDLTNMYVGALKNLLHNVVITKDLTTLQKEMMTLVQYVVKEKDRIDKLYENYSQFQINLKISQKTGEIYI